MGPRFLLQISGSGLVAPSGMFFNAKFSKLPVIIRKSGLLIFLKFYTTKL